MPFIISNTTGQFKYGAQSNMYPSAITNLSASSSVAGQILLTWSGGLGNNVQYSYALSTGTIQSVSGSAGSVTITLASTSQITTTVTLTASVLGGSASASTTVTTQLPPAPVTITNIASTNASYTGNRLTQSSGNLITGDGIVIGTSTTNGLNYNVYAFGTVSTSATYTLTYNSTSNVTAYVLAVGGGAGGVGCAGSGAGGVVMLPITVNSATGGTITVSVGAGGTGVANQPNVNTPGKITTVTGANLYYNGSNITVTGGGGGAGYQNTAAPSAAIQNGISGGSGGGSSASTSNPAGTTNNANYNFANNASTSTWYSGGGGGASAQVGRAGGSNSNNLPVNGANGIQCLLPGIADFAPSGYSAFNTYYWGGAGGTGYGSPAGNGGRGGGGGGGDAAVAGVGDTYGIYPGASGTVNGRAGAGGQCTGGSGGSGSTGTASGNGGNGIVVIAFPAVSSTKVVPTISNYNFASPSVTLNTKSNILNTATTSSTLTGWTCTASSANSSIDLIDGSSNVLGISSTTVGYQNVLLSFSSSAATGATSTISQSINFTTAGNFSLIYYTIQSILYNAATMTVNINSTSSTATAPYDTNTWIAQRMNFTIATPGNYTLTFTATNGTTGTATAVGLSYISIL